MILSYTHYKETLEKQKAKDDEIAKLQQNFKTLTEVLNNTMNLF